MPAFYDSKRQLVGGRPCWITSSHVLPDICVRPADTSNGWLVTLVLPQGSSTATYLTVELPTIHDLGQLLTEWKFDPEGTTKKWWNRALNDDISDSATLVAGPVRNPADLGL